MTKKFTLAYILIVFIALAFRLPGLSFRPMHGDEAVNAIKYSNLLEQGEYHYNPAEYHGPTLYYFTLPVTYLASENTLQELTEVTLRIVPLVFYFMLFAGLLTIKNRVGQVTVLMAALLLALSPAFVFYSRYYIHEMLFVCFSYAVIFAAYRLYQKASVTWSVILGITLALMMATKETWIILFFAALISLSLLIVIYPQFRSEFIVRLKNLSPIMYITGSLSFLLVYVVMFTSFMQDISGFWDSFYSIWNYSSKSVENSVHNHPWYQYIKWLLFNFRSGNFWSEGIIALLAITGVFYGFNSKFSKSVKLLFFMKFMSLFTLIALAIFSVILYKTPWNALSFWFGMIILAGFGYSALMRNIHKLLYKKMISGIVIIAIIDLAWQSYQLNFTYNEDPGNPYTYAQPQKDIFRLLNPLQDIAQKNPDKENIYIQVIVENNDYWPLPWYLRDFSKVGWWSNVNMELPSADIIITSPGMEGDLLHKFYEINPPGKRDLYVPLLSEDVNLRPGVKINALVKLDIYNLIH